MGPDLKNFMTQVPRAIHFLFQPGRETDDLGGWGLTWPIQVKEWDFEFIHRATLENPGLSPEP